MKKSPILMIALSVVIACGFKSKDASILTGNVKAVSPECKESVEPKSRTEYSELNKLIVGAVAIHKITDDEVILQKMAGDVCLIWVNLKTGEQRNLVTRGRGPGEIGDAGGFCGSRINADGDVEFAVYETNYSKCYVYNLTKTLAEGRSVVMSEMTIPRNTIYCLWLGETTLNYVFDSGISLRICDSDGNDMKVRQPFGDEDYLGEERNFYGYHFFCGTDYSKKHDKVILAMCSLPRLYVYDMNGKRSLSICYGRELDKELIAKLKSPDCKLAQCYLHAVALDDCIYTLCVDPEAALKGEMRQEIRIYSWSGEYLKKISIPDFLINFIVSDDCSRVIGITPSSELIEYVL